MSTIDPTNDTDEDLRMDDPESLFDRWPRHNWLDQFRGLCVLLYIIAVLTWGLSGDVHEGILPVGPTYYNHGWAISMFYYSSTSFLPSQFPPLITIIDLGQPVLVCLVGIMQAYSYQRRKAVWGSRAARNHVIMRVALLFGCSVILEDMLLTRGLFVAFFDGAFAGLAWASLFGAWASTWTLKGDKLVGVGIGITLLHAILYAIPRMNTWTVGQDWYMVGIPWKMINLSALAIIGAGYKVYLFDESGVMRKNAFKSKILPLTGGFFIGNYLLSYLQWADQPHCTTSLSWLAMGFIGGGMFLFYAYEQINYSIPLLSALGRNMWIFFIGSPILEWIWILLLEDLVRSSAIAAFILIGIMPLVIVGGVAFLFDRKKILLRI